MTKHASDFISLIFGVLLAGSGALLLVVDAPPDDFPAYAGPALIGVLGLLLLAVGASRSAAQPSDPAQTEITQIAETEDPPAEQ